MSNVKHITVSEDEDGQRVDRWLKKHVPGLPNSLMYKLLRKGQVRVDGKRVKPDKRLVSGQDVRIPPVEEKTFRAKPGPTRADAAYIKSLVIYDDGAVIAINKPAGLAVQGGTNTDRHIDGMLEALADEKGVKPRLVHRLDKETSGVLLLARSAEVARALGRSFKGRDVKKIYWAIVVPAPDRNEGTINAPLTKAGEKTIIDEENGKKAETDFVVLERAAKKAAFVAFFPRTGRTHQIRVHAADILRCPVLGDGRYGGQNARLSGMDIPKRLHLHAQQIILPHPMKDETLDIQAPLPDDLEKSWKSLGFETSSQYCAFNDSCSIL